MIVLLGSHNNTLDLLIPLKCHYIQLTKLHCEFLFFQFRCAAAWTRPHLPFLGLRRQTLAHISLSKTTKENRSVFRKITMKNYVMMVLASYNKCVMSFAVGATGSYELAKPILSLLSRLCQLLPTNTGCVTH